MNVTERLDRYWHTTSWDTSAWLAMRPAETNRWTRLEKLPFLPSENWRTRVHHTGTPTWSFCVTSVEQLYQQRPLLSKVELLRVYHNRDATEKSSWKSKTNRGQTGRELWSQSQRKSFHLEFVWRRYKRPHRITKLIVMLCASRNAQSIFQVIWRMEYVNQCLSTWVQKSRRNQRKLENFTRRTKEHPFLVENKSLVIPWKILTFCKCRTNNKRNLNMIFRLAYKKCLRKVPYLQHNVPFNNFYLLHNVTVSRIMKKKKNTKLDLLRKSDKTENQSNKLGP